MLTTVPDPAARPAEPRHMHLGDRLPDADVGRMEALLELLGDDALQGRADLPHLAEEAELTDQELLPLAQALALLGFAQLADADLHLTPLGQRYVEGAHTLRQQLFGQQLLAHVPLAAHIRHSLEQAPSGALPQEPFLLLLGESLDAAVAAPVLRTAIEWGRYGEVFEYDFHTGLIHLPEGETAARRRPPSARAHFVAAILAAVSAVPIHRLTLSPFSVNTWTQSVSNTLPFGSSGRSQPITVT